MSEIAPPETEDQRRARRYAEEPNDLPEHARWPGPGPAPASWRTPDGGKAYRSYEDYCDD